jgi:hypothetical protein
MIGTACGGSILLETVRSVFAAVLYGSPFRLFWSPIKGTCPDASAMEIVKEAKSHKATHLMLVDNDVSFAPWSIEQLVEHDKMVVGAGYNFRTLPLCSTITMTGENGKQFHPKSEELPEKLFTSPDLMLPGGFILIDMRVYDAISPPYYQNIWEEDRLIMTPDNYFCDKVKKAGIEIWCDPTIIINHIGSYAY